MSDENPDPPKGGKGFHSGGKESCYIQFGVLHIPVLFWDDCPGNVSSSKGLLLFSS
jgi:hypothetical protein